MLLSGCVGLPDGVTPIDNFDAERYFGKWFEIARLDHSFERGLEQVTAEYTIRQDGGINVINRGFSPSKGEWREATGKAYFVNSKSIGYLKVSFFGPFYGSYVIIELDKVNYSYALVSGPNTSYLWILSRTPCLSKETLQKLIHKADKLGFDTSKLIFVNQQKMPH